MTDSEKVKSIEEEITKWQMGNDNRDAILKIQELMFKIEHILNNPSPNYNTLSDEAAKQTP